MLASGFCKTINEQSGYDALRGTHKTAAHPAVSPVRDINHGIQIGETRTESKHWIVIESDRDILCGCLPS